MGGQPTRARQDFGTLLDLLAQLGLAEDTLVVFAGDNGPEDLLLWRGSPGYWEGSYFAGGEGNLRTPCLVRWPGHIPQGMVSDDIMHVTDWFCTILAASGAPVPTDRVIHGVNQLDWLTGKSDSSNREGYIYWMGPEMFGIRWCNFKLVLVEQRYLADPPARLTTPAIINLTIDPHERERYSLPHLHTWVLYHFNEIMSAFQHSVQTEPLIPMGAPLDHTPVG